MSTNHISPEDIEQVLVPEMNRIYQQIKIYWQLESILEEDGVVSDTYEADVAYVLAAERSAAGRSDPDRLPPLYRMMPEATKSTTEQLEAETNLFHLYVFPFIGNTGHGNAMRSFHFSTVLGAWSNKYKDRHGPGHCAPQRRPLVEAWDAPQVGSLARTMAHEVGHVLGLDHDSCVGVGRCLMKGTGYTFNPDQVCTARELAAERTPLVE